MLRMCRGKEEKQDRNWDEGLLKLDLEREGEKWRERSTDRRNWRLLIENVETESEMPIEMA